ncbi:MAG TPA: hypothetical protein VN326_20140 [Casimicrobiaceae bacterium]|nr:hypothetical protein [Casimicrobiaceae bacterium]
MDTAIVSALSAVLGSAVGGSATLATAWITQKTQSRREIVGAEIQRRQSLYGEFIAECSKLLVDALDHTLDNPEKLFQIYALQNRIRLTSSDAVVAAADEALNRIIKQYFEQNITREQLRDVILAFADDRLDGHDPLKAFSEACRDELQGLQRAL